MSQEDNVGKPAVVTHFLDEQEVLQPERHVKGKKTKRHVKDN